MEDFKLLNLKDNYWTEETSFDFLVGSDNYLSFKVIANTELSNMSIDIDSQIDTLIYFDGGKEANSLVITHLNKDEEKVFNLKPYPKNTGNYKVNLIFDYYAK